MAIASNTKIVKQSEKTNKTKGSNKKQIAVKLPKSLKRQTGAKKSLSLAKDKKEHLKTSIQPLLPENLNIDGEKNEVPELPSSFLVSMFGQIVQVHLKFNNAMYKGVLISTDEYFNLRLKNTVEFIGGKETGKIGDCFIRCNTVLFINQKND
ncbi:hypothetical protein QEN19_000833 [Hanseniaspora menglaensis]